MVPLGRMTGRGMCRRSFEVQEVQQIQAKEKEIAEAMSEITDLSKKLEQAKKEGTYLAQGSPPLSRLVV